eukprot:1858474-Lingulodinium_polyedra.AAC.1
MEDVDESEATGLEPPTSSKSNLSPTEQEAIDELQGQVNPNASTTLVGVKDEPDSSEEGEELPTEKLDPQLRQLLAEAPEAFQAALRTPGFLKFLESRMLTREEDVP